MIDTRMKGALLLMKSLGSGLCLIAGLFLLLGMGAACLRSVPVPGADNAALLAVDFAPVLRSFLPLDPAPLAGSGQGIALRMERSQARPGDRWLDLVLDLDADLAGNSGARLELALYAPGASRPVARRSLPVDSSVVQVSVDLRDAGLRAARFRAELVVEEEVRGSVEALLGALPPVKAWPPDRPIPVALDLPEGRGPLRDWPITFGVPFPAGALWDVADLRLVNGHGEPIPFQAEIAGRWARDGAVKWVRFDALADSAAGVAMLVGPQEAAALPATGLTVTQHEQRVTVRHGAWSYRIEPGGGLLAEVLKEGRTLVRSGERGLYVIDQEGRLGRACPRDATLTIESAGPLAASVKIEGPYRTAAGETLAHHSTRLEFFAGRPEVQGTHTLILSRDTNEIWFREVGWDWQADAGAGPRALASAGRRARAQPLETLIEEGEALVVSQDDHEQFGGGENHFRLLRARASGEEEVLHAGDLMGDWAALVGARGGLLLSCREAARQHPKELRLTGTGVELKLFSPRGGRELDFRSPALVERWNRGARLSAAAVQEIRELDSNAQGWSKTHHLLLTPLSGPADLEEAALRADLHSEPLYARVDPRWIHATRAMGPLYPRDVERFPEAEAFVEEAARFWQPRRFQSGDYGFVDYAAGPHHSAMGSGTTRYDLSYTVRHDMWLVYARGGERGVREFAETSNRTYMDGNMCHWDVPGARGSWSRHKYRGLLTSGGGWYGRLPYYWGTSVAAERSTSTNLDQFLFDHYLTGYRRAADVVAAYADGIQRWWAEGRNPRGRDFWREKIFMQALTQAYNHTFDSGLIPILDEVIQHTHAPHGVVQISRDVPHNTVNKLPSDIHPLIQTWEFWGDRRVHAMARAVADYLQPHLGIDPSGLRHRFGMLADFLYRETGEASIGEAVALSLRQALAGSPESSSSVAVFRLQGIPYALSTIAATGADRRATASWVDYQDFGYPASVIVRKADRAALRVRYRGGRTGLRVTPLGDTRAWLLRIYPLWIDLPYDSDGGNYELTPGESGSNFFLSEERVPMVLYAPHYWRPGPAGEAPRSPVFFKLPAGTERPRIFFEGSARLFDPSGTAWPTEEAVSGWQRLPVDRVGVWSFVPEENHLVRVRHIPPFFAFRDAEAFFVPEDLDWELPPLADFDPPSFTPETLYLAGPGEDGERRGLFLDADQTFVVEAGSRDPAGEDGLSLPAREGTVEFWFQPFWGSFDLNARLPRRRYDSRTLATLVLSDQSVPLQYHTCLGRVGWPPSRYNYSHTLRANFTTQGPANSRTPGYLRHIFEPGEWVHVAWTWGSRPVKTRRGLKDAFETRIYINGGSAGQRHTEHRLGNTLAHPVEQLVLGGPALQGVFSDLRISSTQRYFADFTPPPPGSLTVDGATGALFTFDGRLEPEGAGREDQGGQPGQQGWRLNKPGR